MNARNGFRLSLLVMTLIAAGFLAAQDAVTDVNAILDRYVRAIGGQAAVERITSRVAKGSLVTTAGSAPMEIYEKAPDKFMRILDSPASGRSEGAFDGAVAWMLNKQQGLRELAGPEVENFKREYSLHRQILWKQLYSEMRAAGQESVDGRVVEVVEAKADPDLAYKFYFDKESGLLVRSDVTIRGTTLQNFYQDYREVDGVKLPFTIRHARPDGFQWSDQFSEIRHNVAIEDARFAKPVERAAQQAAQQQPASTPAAQGQAPRRSPIPDTFTNLQVLPKDISKAALVDIMKNFCFTMDQRCSYCHVATDDLSSADFPSDEKETKKKARELLRLILAAKKDAAVK